MSAPKRLWAGDWQRESDALSEDLANRRANRPEPEPEAPPRALPEPDAPHRLRVAMRAAAAWLGAMRPGPRLKKALPIAVAALLILAAGAYALTSMLGSSNRSASQSVIHASPPVYWLGMQLESTQPGQVVVATVAPGSRAEQAGLDPGDVIPAVNGKSLNATSDLTPAIKGLKSGDQVEIKVSRGSTLFTTHASLTAPPSNNP